MAKLIEIVFVPAEPIPFMLKKVVQSSSGERVTPNDAFTQTGETEARSFDEVVMVGVFSSA